MRRPFLTLLFLAAFFWTGLTLHAAARIPNQLNDREFWQMISEYSEDGGSYPEENLTSNEIYFQNVIPDLQARTKSGGVYLGVGPEQNFTYVAAMKPKIAFIVDIRRENMLELLMYKALFEMASNRADFLSQLFSRKRPAGLNENSTAKELIAEYQLARPDPAIYSQNLRAIKDCLIRHHGFGLSSEDLSGIDHIYAIFFRDGPGVNFSGKPPTAYTAMTYSELMTATDRQGLSPDGRNRGFLAAESNYGIVREMQLRNLIVPLTGDFAGPKTIRAVGAYLKDHGATVTAFYVSNVETYLLNRFSDYMMNVEALPTDISSTFIRSSAPSFVRIESPVVPGNAQTLVSMLASMVDVLKGYHDGHIRSWLDVNNMLQ